MQQTVLNSTQLTEQFQLCGDLIHFAEVEDLKVRGNQLIDLSCEQSIVVDLAGLAGANSVTVALLLAWYRHAALQHKQLLLTNVAPALQNIIDFSGLADVLSGD